jgi:hypothetical protein
MLSLANKIQIFIEVIHSLKLVKDFNAVKSVR